MGGEAMMVQSNEQSCRLSVICANCKDTRHSVEFCVKDVLNIASCLGFQDVIMLYGYITPIYTTLVTPYIPQSFFHYD